MRVGDILQIILVKEPERVCYVRIDQIYPRCRKCGWHNTHVSYFGRSCPHEQCDVVFSLRRARVSKRDGCLTWTMLRGDFSVIRNVTLDMSARKIYAFWERHVVTIELSKHFPTDIVRLIVSHASNLRDPREHAWLNGIDMHMRDVALLWD